MWFSRGSREVENREEGLRFRARPAHVLRVAARDHPGVLRTPNPPEPRGPQPECRALAGVALPLFLVGPPE